MYRPSRLPIPVQERRRYADIRGLYFLHQSLILAIVVPEGSGGRNQVRLVILDNRRSPDSITRHVVHKAGDTHQEQEEHKHYVEHDERVQYQQAHHASDGHPQLLLCSGYSAHFVVVTTLYRALRATYNTFFILFQNHNAI